MDKKKNGLSIMIILEMLVLIIVLVVGLLTVGLHSRNGLSHQDSGNQQEAYSGEPEPEKRESAEDAVAAVAGGGEEARDNEISTEDLASVEVETKLAEMTTEQKVAQLFMVNVDAFTEVNKTSVVGDTFRSNYTDYPVGGLVFMTGNISQHDQITDMTADAVSVSNEIIGLPVYTAVYEYGGSSAGSSPAGYFAESGTLETLQEIGAAEDAEAVSDWASQMAAYLSDMGFDLNLGLNADLSNEGEESDYTFGTDADQVGNLVGSAVESYEERDVAVCLRAFPGMHEAEDSDYGLPVLDKTAAELVSDEYVTFGSGIDAGAQMVQLADVLCNAVTRDDTTPCSISENTVNLLRNDLQFDGIILSGDVNNSAVAEACDGNTAVAALEAGADMLYCTENFKDTYQAVLDAVNDGTISESKLDRALSRILTQKME